MKRIEYRAVLFDLDGTLIDSERNYAISDGRLLAEYGVAFDDALRERCIGKGVDEFLGLLRDEYGVTEAKDILLAKKNAYYLEIARGNTRVFPEMLELVETLHKLEVPLAVASGSPLLIIREMLKGLGLEGYFAAAVSSEEVARGKPFPDVFLETARRLGVPPAGCLVFEDSPYGVEAAKAGGMKVVAIPTLTEPPIHASFAAADILYPKGMEEFRAEDVLARLDHSLFGTATFRR